MKNIMNISIIIVFFYLKLFKKNISCSFNYYNYFVLSGRSENLKLYFKFIFNFTNKLLPPKNTEVKVVCKSGQHGQQSCQHESTQLK